MVLALTTTNLALNLPVDNLWITFYRPTIDESGTTVVPLNL